MATTVAPAGYSPKRVWARGILVELMGWLHLGWAAVVTLIIAAGCDLSVNALWAVFIVLGAAGFMLMLAGMALWWLADSEGPIPLGPLSGKLAVALGNAAKWASLVALSPAGFFGGKMCAKYGEWCIWNHQLKAGK